MARAVTGGIGPDYSREERWIERGFAPVAGVDEAGRGPLAGPVVVAACCLDPLQIPSGLNDSKKLGAARREALFDLILQTSHCAIVIVSAGIIDKINIRAATLKGMAEAVDALSIRPGAVLVDGLDWPALDVHGEAVIKGDALSLSIAAASILAKVTRDRMMKHAEQLWPGSGFDRHAGYGTASHLCSLEFLGASPIHRKSFAPLKSYL